MEHSSAHPVRPAGSPEVDAFSVFSWHERHEVEEPGFARGSMEEPTLVQILTSLPDWAMISAGGVVAAILGAMVGGALHI